MKLLMITGLGSARDLASGRQGAFYNTLEELHNYWDRIDIIAPKIETKDLERKQVSYEIGGGREVTLFGNVFIHISPWPLVFHPVWFLKKGLEIYRKQKFDLMTVQDFPPFYNGIGARLLWNKIRVPYILEFHHIPGYPRAGNFKEGIYAKRLLWKFYWNIFGSRASAVRVVNRKQTPGFLKTVGVPENKIVYIPSIYVDFSVFKPSNQEKEYDIIFVGRLEKNKGIGLLLDATRILSTKYGILNIKTLIVGGGPLKNKCEAHISSYSLGGNIKIWGRAKDYSEIAGLMNKSKILVMPSYNEGGPRVVVEAMACGVPVLATNVGLIPDFADRNAVKVIDWDPEDIAKKIKELLENEEERKRLSQAGLEVARQFDKKEMIKNYAEKIQRLT